MRRVLDWVLLIVLVTTTLLWLVVDATRAETPFPTESRQTHPWLFPWSDRMSREPWWVFWPLQESAGGGKSNLQVLVARNEAYNDTRLVSTIIGTAAHEVSHGRRVAEVRIPTDPSLIGGETLDGRTARLNRGQLVLSTGGKIVQTEYETILDAESIQLLDSSGRLSEYPMSVFAYVDADPHDRVVVLQDLESKRIYVLPLELAEELVEL